MIVGRLPHRAQLVFAIVVCLGILQWPAPALQAQALPYTEDVPVVGGTAALAAALHITPAPEPARFVTELTRILYATPEGLGAPNAALVARLVSHLDVVGRFQRALALVQPEGRPGLALDAAADKADRRRLNDFLDLVGLTLRTKDRTMSVERTSSKDAVTRVALLKDFGIDVGALAERLNRGETVHLDVPTELVPVPLAAATWSQAVFRKPTDAASLFAAIITNRDAALLCHGLAALDDDTLAFLSGHPVMLGSLYEHHAGTFAAFGGALIIRDNRVIVPGGDAATAVWESVLDEKTARVEKFVDALFGRDEGRAAYLYDTMARLDPARRAFAVGSWMADAELRADRFKSLLGGVNRDAWTPRVRPFRRPPSDFAEIALRVRVEPDGAPGAPASRLLWARAFESTDLPDDPSRELKHIEREGVIDAAWLVDAIAGGDAPLRVRRLDQFAFGQRVFASAADNALGDVLVAVRAFDRYPSLMLTIERMGVRNPAVYAAAARQAAHVSALDPNRAFYALVQYQGAVALLARLSKVGALDASAADALLRRLAAAPLDRDGWYAGGIARWIQADLLPRLPVRNTNADRVEDVDRLLLSALAGTRREPAALVSWEDQQYRVDLVAPELTRLTRVVEKLAAPPVRLAFAIEAAAVRFAHDEATLANVQAGAADLQRIAEVLPAGGSTRAIVPPGIDPPRPLRDTLAKAVQELTSVKRPQDVKRAARVAELLRTLVDRELAEALIALAYALDIGPAEGAALLAGNVSLRHDFGFTLPEPRARAARPWRQGEQVISPGVPWHVSGSLLSLDVSLADLSIRRTSARRPAAPVLSGNDRDAFVATLGLVNPFALTDAGRDAITAAIERGRERLTAALSGRTFDALADEIHVDGWRRRAARWTLVHAPDRLPSLFSLSELLLLGGANGPELDAWGVSAFASTGCLCTRLPVPGVWAILIGRPNLGMLATQVADLNLRVAMALAELKLPAALAGGVLAAALEDVVAGLRPIDSDDWLGLVRGARTMPRERFEDYVASLTASGPLVADTPPRERPSR